MNIQTKSTTATDANRSSVNTFNDPQRLNGSRSSLSYPPLFILPDPLNEPLSSLPYPPLLFISDLKCETSGAVMLFANFPLALCEQVEGSQARNLQNFLKTMITSGFNYYCVCMSFLHQLAQKWKENKESLCALQIHLRPCLEPRRGSNHKPEYRSTRRIYAIFT